MVTLILTPMLIFIPPTEVYVWKFINWQQSFSSCSVSLCSAPSRPPSNVAFIFTYRSKTQLKISWSPPPTWSWNGILTGYQVCYSDKARSSSPICFLTNNAQSSTFVINNLRPATKYFVTVAAGTSVGYGTKSADVSRITDGGKTQIWIPIC